MQGIDFKFLVGEKIYTVRTVNGSARCLQHGGLPVTVTLSVHAPVIVNLSLLLPLRLLLHLFLVLPL